MIAKALPRAIQVADRWHLMENAGSAFVDAVRRSMGKIRNAIGAATINPDLLTAAERLRAYRKKARTDHFFASDPQTVSCSVRSGGRVDRASTSQ